MLHASRIALRDAFNLFAISRLGMPSVPALVTSQGGLPTPRRAMLLDIQACKDFLSAFRVEPQSSFIAKPWFVERKSKSEEDGFFEIIGERGHVSAKTIVQARMADREEERRYSLRASFSYRHLPSGEHSRAFPPSFSLLQQGFVAVDNLQPTDRLNMSTLLSFDGDFLKRALAGHPQQEYICSSFEEGQVTPRTAFLIAAFAAVDLSSPSLEYWIPETPTMTYQLSLSRRPEIPLFPRTTRALRIHTFERIVSKGMIDRQEPMSFAVTYKPPHSVMLSGIVPSVDDPHAPRRKKIPLPARLSIDIYALRRRILPTGNIPLPNIVTAIIEGAASVEDATLPLERSSAFF